jgi:hypothetical protein
MCEQFHVVLRTGAEVGSPRASVQSTRVSFESSQDMVPQVGVEPTCPKAAGFESAAYTNSTTEARTVWLTSQAMSTEM